MSALVFALEGETANILSSGLTNLGTVIDNVMTIITGNAVLTAMFIVPLVGAGIGLIKRLV